MNEAPNLAYFDQTRTCVDCGETFVFTKEQQEFFYDKMKFEEWSRPTRCKSCKEKMKTLHEVDISKPPPEKDNAATTRYLWAIGKQSPTHARIAEVQKYLGSARHDVRSVAAQVLAAWNSRESLPLIRARFEATVWRPGHYAECGVMKKAMAKLLRSSDTEEIVRWFLSLPTYNQRFELLDFFSVLDPRIATPLLEAAWPNADREMKHSILIAANVDHAKKLFAEAIRDKDAYVREFAETRVGKRDSSDWMVRWVYSRKESKA